MSSRDPRIGRSSSFSHTLERSGQSKEKLGVRKLADSKLADGDLNHNNRLSKVARMDRPGDRNKDYDPGSPVGGSSYDRESPLRRTQASLQKEIPGNSKPKGYYSNKQQLEASSGGGGGRGDTCSNTSDDDRLVLNPMFSPIASSEPTTSPAVKTGSRDFDQKGHQPSGDQMGQPSRRSYEWELPIRQKPAPSESFLSCVICKQTPQIGPLFGCGQGHIICNCCQEKGGVLLSCPTCKDQNISNRLNVAESLLPNEVEKYTLVDCRYKDSGCNLAISQKKLLDHEQSCLFQTVKCPKAMFSNSCAHSGPLCTIQQHGRDKHGLHKGVTEIERGVISSKMFDKGGDVTCCSDNNNAKFQPLELSLADNKLFYCYFERVAGRRMWFFFIRMFGSETTASRFTAHINIGPAALDKQEREKAWMRYSGGVAHYAMSKDEVRHKGLVLSVADEVVLSFKKENVLFRIWFEVKESRLREC